MKNITTKNNVLPVNAKHNNTPNINNGIPKYVTINGIKFI